MTMPTMTDLSYDNLFNLSHEVSSESYKAFDFIENVYEMCMIKEVLGNTRGLYPCEGFDLDADLFYVEEDTGLVVSISYNDHHGVLIDNLDYLLGYAVMHLDGDTLASYGVIK